ncbi:transporter substrate-binding domain-containing protein [Paracoccus laeviglucosivorans]|uniref:Amino acid ABC transporter substrate-binding protein, PAAT family n=1 Tax=Paracoccus laeviglucosivorans TaxID=1197861 RepID=A0A521BIS1_9RHOB|nr:transporter substrate-binding domain-containing protein [Paracoccus laeviglucosivorans]SMO47034.1 amino acid ABC transporter substrate-binding protein, PAAT family [Paracoccus laeviglucosivorans]
MTFKLAAVAALMTAAATPSLAEALWDKIERTGEVTCGGIHSYKPTSFYTGSDLVYEGYGPNVCRQMVADLSKEMGKPLAVKWHETTWQTVVLDLQAGRIDIFPGMTATEERKKALDMAGPLYRMTDCVIAGKKAETKPTWQDYNTPDSTFAMVTGTAQTNFLKTDVPEAKIMTLKEMSESVMAVQSGRADYLLQELPICLQTFSTAPQVFSGYTVPTPPAGIPAAAGLRKDGDGRLRDFIQKWGEEKRADQSIAPLLIEGFKAAGMDTTKIPEGIEF